MTKIAISSEGPSLEDQVDPRFGRAAGFVMVDPDTMESQYLDNGSSQVLAQGAGIQAAQIIAKAGATWVLTGYVGPKAFQALTAVGIKVGQNLEGLTVREAVAKFQSGTISLAQTPNQAAR
jgi:predicted Fe-Mo cluster-binding NifX family protein